MTAYYLMLLILSFCGACLCIRNRSRLKDGIFLSISFTVLGTMSAIRYDVGYDYSMIYSPNFEKFKIDPSLTPWEPGFKWLLGRIFSITQNYHVPFVIISFIIVLLIMLFFWLYSPNPFISVFLFVALSHYYCSMNFMRQMLAAAITMYAFPLMKKRTASCVAGYFAVVLLAASFHKSAAILIPFFLINLIPVNKYVLAAYTAITAVIYFNTHRIVAFVTRYWYSMYGLDNIHMEVALEPPFTIAVTVVLLIVFLGSGMLTELDQRNYLYVNYAFFTVFFMLMGTRHSILDRLSMYFELLAPVGVAIIVHELVKKLKQEKPVTLLNKYTAMLVSLLLVIFGGGLAIHQYALTMDHHGVVPYKIIFNQPFYRDYIASLKNSSVDAEIFVEPEKAPEFLPPSSAPPRAPHADTVKEQQAEAIDGKPIEISLEDFLNG